MPVAGKGPELKLQLPPAELREAAFLPFLGPQEAHSCPRVWSGSCNAAGLIAGGGGGFPGAAPQGPPSTGPRACPVPSVGQRPRGVSRTAECIQSLPDAPGPLVINENLNILLPGWGQGFGKPVADTPGSLRAV